MFEAPRGYRIEPGRRQQLRSLQELEHAAARLFEGHGIPREVIAQSTPLRFFERGCEDGLLWVALADGDPRPAGFALCEVLRASLHLDELDVHPDHGRRGLGRALVGRAARQALARGLRALTLTTYRQIPWNAPWYARLGFEELAASRFDDELRAIVQEEADAGLDPGERVVMRLRLAQRDASA